LKIRTIEELEDKLESDLSWRKKEILSLKLLIDSDEINKKILLRSGIALLCAHFEGFIKNSSNYYIIYVSNLKIKSNYIINTLVAIKIKNSIKSCSETDKHSIHGEMLNLIEKIKEKSFFIKYTEDKPIISTNSNPTSEVLKEILKTIGINSEIFDIKKQYIDHSLLMNRHKVVHGERHDLDYEDFISTFNIVLELLDSYKELIIHAAESELFLKEKQNSECAECI
jgi:hypothetical protein